MMDRIGELAALGTALCWTVTALSFERAGKRVGSLQVNLIRLVISLVFFTAYQLLRFGRPLPLDAPASVWVLLSLSGLIGFVIGDLLLFQAFVELGARVAMLIYSSVPILTTLIAWFILGELPSGLQFFAMLLTVGGISLVVVTRAEAVSTSSAASAAAPRPSSSFAAALRRMRLRHSGRGVLLALGGAVGQAAGLVISRSGAPEYDAFGATQIRVIAGAVGFAVVISLRRAWPAIGRAVRDRVSLGLMANGAFFGPFLGVSLGLLATQNTETGVAATIIALVPVLIIPWSRWVMKEEVGLRDALGAAIAVAGVALLFLAPR